jgi:serine/threonine-protein kinase RsbW
VQGRVPCEKQHRFSGRLPAEPASARVARDRVRDLLAAADIDPAVHLGVLLAITEACANAIVHAYPGGTDETFDFAATLADRELRVVVRDHGVGMGAAPARPGGPGLGLHLMRAHAAELDVRTVEPGTEIVMTFPLAG